MSSEASVQQSKMDSAVVFMQQEHAATLKALHDEIHKLQTKCTDLTFQLTMNGVNIEEGGDADSRLMEIHKQLQKSEAQKKRLEVEVVEKKQKEEQLMQELRSMKKRHLDEKRVSEQTLSSLQAETEAKANNIAYLTTELHRLKLARSAEVSEEEGGDPKTLLPPHPPSQRGLRPHGPGQHSHLPAPPRDVLTSSARLRHQRGVPLPRSGLRRVGTLGAAASEHHSRLPDQPDISPFLHRDSDATARVKKPPAPPQPLPPIAGSRVRSGRGAGREREVHRVLIAGGAQLSRASVPEVATLAVDQINSAGTAGPRVGWQTLPPTQSHNN